MFVFIIIIFFHFIITIIICFRITFWSKLAKFALLALIYDLQYLFWLQPSENEISPLLKHGMHASDSYFFWAYLPVNSIATLCSGEFKITSHQQVKERASLQNGTTKCLSCNKTLSAI